LTRIAVIADVHANATALASVLDSIRGVGAQGLVCLGDVVGYNAEPEECVRLLRAHADLTVVGNHDLGALGMDSIQGTSTPARAVQAWTHQRLDESSRDWLAALPARAIVGGEIVAVHGCYMNDLHYTGYVTSTMLPSNLEAIASRPEWPVVALCGHTHAPMCGWLRGDVCDEPPLDDKGVSWPADADAVLLNPGSVGQPRDGDPRAAWLLLDLAARRAQLFRVPYDVESAAGAIADAGLPLEHASRLREGR